MPLASAHRIATAAFLALTPLTPALATPLDDATRIVELTVTPEIFTAAMGAQAPLIGAALANQFAGMGIEISDMPTFLQILSETMVDGFTTRMRAASIPFYLDTFSAEDLANMRAFYESPTGAAQIAATPALLAFGATTGERIGNEIGLTLGPDLGRRLEAEGVVITSSPSMMPRLLDTLR